MAEEREVLEVDVLVVGGGSAGLACALHLKRLLQEKNVSGGEVSIAVIEKGGAFGNHSLSGAVMDPRGLAELLPDYRERGCPIESDVVSDAVYFLTGRGAWKLPFTPPMLNNHGYHVVSLNRLTGWLAELCEASGVDLFPGFAGQEMLYEGNRVIGVRTGDKGRDKAGAPRGNFEPGVEIRAQCTILAEGVRGSLCKELIPRLGLDAGRNPQIYATGVKEVWERPEGARGPGRVIHTLGYPLDARTYGGGWIYDMADRNLSIGFAVGLDSRNPYSDPHRSLQLYKRHPFIRQELEGGKLLRYGAKAIPEGGYWSLPRSYGNGVLLVGDCGGFLNAQRLKGIHLAIKTGMLAAETVHEGLVQGDTSARVLAGYEERLKGSWVDRELYGCRNFRQGFQQGLWAGLFQTGLQLATGGRGLKSHPTTRPDHMHMLRRSELSRVGLPDQPPAPLSDDPETLTFSKLTSVYHSGTVHEENQPCHLHVADTDVCRTRCAEEYGNPCEHFCPASVYHMVSDEERGGRRLQIDFTNCVHCKTCDIMDPYQIIAWVPPQGGEGPVYTSL